MFTRKLSISLPGHVFDFMESYQFTHHCKSRSEVIVKALELLQHKELKVAYRKANAEYDEGFDACNMDGLQDEPI